MHHFILTDAAPTTIAKAVGDQKRTFSGIANSGKPFVYHGERAIADLSSISFAGKVPILLLHDREKRVGVGTLVVKDNQLIVSGDLLDNEYGKQVADEADAGFPWQMSAHLIADSVETLADGQSAIINGQTVSGRINILKNCRVSEISFTPTGVDNQTIAHILSDNFQPNQSQENAVNNEQLLAKINELTAKLTEQSERISTLEQENKALKDEKQALEAQNKEANVEAQLSAKGFVKDDKGIWVGVDKTTVEVLLSLDSDKAAAVIDNLSAPKANVPEFLLGENYGNQQTQAPTNPLLAVIGGGK